MIVFHLIQVKEACGKASEAEELAKDRLGQMNYELDIHCRITVSITLFLAIQASFVHIFSPWAFLTLYHQ